MDYSSSGVLRVKSSVEIQPRYAITPIKSNLFPFETLHIVVQGTVFNK